MWTYNVYIELALPMSNFSLLSILIKNPKPKTGQFVFNDENRSHIHKYVFGMEEKVFVCAFAMAMMIKNENTVKYILYKL